jgi:glycosyltransferase involved in cell wall biosynthesis
LQSVDFSGVARLILTTRHTFCSQTDARNTPFSSRLRSITSPMTRILHVIHAVTGGGAERQMMLLATAQANRGHDVNVSLVRTECADSLRRSGVQVHVVKASGHHDPLLSVRYRTLISRIAPDVVQTWLTQSDVMAGSAALSLATPWVLSERSSADAYPAGWKNSLRARLGKRASIVVANSPGGAEYWKALGVSDGRTLVVPNILDTSSGSDTRIAPLPAGCEGKRIVLGVGRYSAEKNPIVMIDAMHEAIISLAVNGEVDVVALLCGAGPFEATMRARIHELRAENHIKLAGYRDDVPQLLRRASVCLCVSRYEGSPNVVLEAIAASCPLVVSDSPAYLDMVDDTSARIVQRGNVSDTARAIVEVLRDPLGARVRTDAARAILEGHDVQVTVARMDTAYAKAIAQCGRD